jgi:hypothetical protein
MKTKTLLAEFGDLNAVVDYLEDCVTEYLDINGDSTLLFPSLAELIQTYLDDVSYTDEQLTELCELCADHSTINQLVEWYVITF